MTPEEKQEQELVSLEGLGDEFDDDAGQVAFEWDAHEFEMTTKSSGWLTIIVAATVAAVIISFILEQYLVAGVAVVAAAALYVNSRRQPRLLHYQITDLGVAVGQKNFNFNQIKNFWVESNSNEINLELNQRFMPEITFSVEGLPLDQVVAFLSSHVPQLQKSGGNWMDKIIKAIKL